mmetsp:Transcript_80996/g.188161  ORF Transcript_80996/g.188161 Transcript_80996/m.188161 type:complete len:340 (+) Transcript_80996:100-1119(+)|eukprot:CAMPEP_0171070798 /NCGR_PEP_ID=MMETSP0766_2-20121228/9957_1 /TAXON_ID=439317 /ORGANISM="Gambierdiscus australes, Strain CAWD 149" /LENGTH=339 /DNA_ID=CAMNT_0011527309 /DNA_START=81 /DNA_END=1100 /DNA_ORIENTATION=+
MPSVSRLRLCLALLAGVHVLRAYGHGLLTFPPSRNGGSLRAGGICKNGECMWFTNNVNTSVTPSLPEYARTVEPNVTGGPEDVYSVSPWRSPGRAPVLGSGCGVGNGGPHWYWNGGKPPQDILQGADGLTLPEVSAQTWSQGSEVEVAWAITANHGGGYSYRLCSKSDQISEDCFQRNVLRFAGETSWIVYTDGTKKEFRRTTVRAGTYPVGSEWARNPIPGCRMCPTYQKCGPPVDPGPAPGSAAWNDWNCCSAGCDGSGTFKLPSCPPGTAQFPEPVPGLSSFENATWDWSIMDRVVVPENLPPGDYLLSWRWDCEESFQIWQNCADIKIVPPTLVV